MHVVHDRGSVLLRRVTQSQGQGVILGVFFPIGNALYGSYSGMNFALLLSASNMQYNMVSCVQRTHADFADGVLENDLSGWRGGRPYHGAGVESAVSHCQVYVLENF